MNSTKRLCLASNNRIKIGFRMLMHAVKANTTKKAKGLSALLLAAGMTLGATSAVQADDDRFTAREFLEQPESNRSSYISVSLMAANLIAMDNDKEQADCIGDWYSADRKGRNELIYRMMEKHPNYHPMAIIIAIAERECGSFKYISD